MYELVEKKLVVCLTLELKKGRMYKLTKLGKYIEKYLILLLFLHEKRRIPFGSDEENEYSSNIQVADMNALNAALAVIKWKKLCEFYHDFQNEHHVVYGLSTNIITNDIIGNET